MSMISQTQVFYLLFLQLYKWFTNLITLTLTQIIKIFPIFELVELLYHEENTFTCFNTSIKRETYLVNDLNHNFYVILSWGLHAQFIQQSQPFYTRTSFGGYRGDGFGTIQEQYIYCAFISIIIYYYYISSTLDHQALDPGVCRPLLDGNLSYFRCNTQVRRQKKDLAVTSVMILLKDIFKYEETIHFCKWKKDSLHLLQKFIQFPPRKAMEFSVISFLLDFFSISFSFFFSQLTRIYQILALQARGKQKSDEKGRVSIEERFSYQISCFGKFRYILVSK